MPDVDALVRDMIDTLQKARGAVRDELDKLETQSLGQKALLRLDDALRDFEQQTDSLLVMLLDRDAASALIETGEDLLEFFRAAREQVEALLEPDRRPSPKMLA